LKLKIDQITPGFIQRTKDRNKQIIDSLSLANPGKKLSADFIRMYTTNAENGYPSMVYNGMIAPFFATKLKGVVWYQGEANTSLSNSRLYEKMLSSLISSWRAGWEEEKLPFLVVQLPNFGTASEKPEASGWNIVQEAQAKVATKFENVGLVVTNDLGDPLDIHYKDKGPVGKRLALIAQKIAYNDQHAIVQGPMLQSFRRVNHTIELQFYNFQDGDLPNGKSLSSFAIAGADSVFYRASAIVQGSKVIVSATQVQLPVNVRYAFENNPGKIDFYNRAGLPAAPFRTDELNDARKKF